MYPQYPMFQQPMPVYQTMPPQQPVQQMQQPQVSNNTGNIVHVQSEDEMRNYPVAPGNTIIFKNDNAPYLYTKKMDSSQLGQPIIEKFRLVKEDEITETVDPKSECNLHDEIAELKSDIRFIKKKLTETNRSKKSESIEDAKKDGEEK